MRGGHVDAFVRGTGKAIGSENNGEGEAGKAVGVFPRKQMTFEAQRDEVYPRLVRDTNRYYHDADDESGY